MDTGKNKLKSVPIRTMLITFACVLVNFIGKHLAATLELPLWLDCIGTVFAAYVLGPISGALVGCTGNIIYAYWDANSLLYGLTSIFIGISTGMAARKKYFESFFKSTSLAGGLAIGSTLISVVLNLLFYGGSTGNIWGDGVRDYLTERGAAHIVASAAGELYLDFLDKLITILLLSFTIMLIKKGRNRIDAKRKKRVVVGIAALFLCAQAGAVHAYALTETAEDSSYIQQVYNTGNGLPGGHANDIVQTNDGILWVGTSSGLYRYSGSTFRLLEESDTIKNVNCLYVDQEGRLWIGTNDNGLVLAINGKVVNTLDSSNGLPSDCIRSIVQSTSGEYYIGTAEATAVVRIAVGISLNGTIDGVREAQCLSADSGGNVAAVTADGKLYLLKEQKAYELDMPEHDAFSACAFDDKGMLFVGTEDGDVHSCRTDEHALTDIKQYPCWDTGRINQIFFHAGDIWLLTDDGIGILRGDSFHRLNTGDFNSSVRKMAVDYQGNLWFASEKHGLLHLSETSFPNLNEKYGLEPDTANTTCALDGVLYIGTDHGLSAVELSDGRVVENELMRQLSGTAVKCVRADSAGNLWICSSGKGLLRCSPDGEIKSYGEADGVGRMAYVCAELSDGSIAAGGDAGFALIGREKTIAIPYGDSLGSAQILSICQLPDGRIFLGTDGNGIVAVKGGAVVDHLTKEQGLSSGVVRRIVPDESMGILFLVTGNGLCCMENDVIRPLSHFPYSDNYDVVLDGGAAFIPGSAGIHVVRKDALLSGGRFDYALLDHKAGLKGTPTENAWNSLTGSKDLYLSTDTGVVRMNLDAYWSEKRSYRLMVTEIRLDGKSVPIERGSGLTISRDVSSIEFVPEIVNYSMEDPKVSYYLEGVDSTYTTVAQSELGSVVYTNLPHGDYTFHLSVLDEDTGEIREESTYGFTKEKSIHDNDWFLVYMLLVGGLFVGWLTWFVTRVSLQQTIAIQQERLSLALKQVQMGNETILAIAKTVDAKDLLTSKHSQRVSEYSVLIARKLGFSEDEQENLRKAALLHDIGKIGIPDSILNKPERLTDREYAIMKTHVTSGAEILKDFTLIEHVVEGAKYHHERYDGRGYPDGLTGKNIPLYGRIIAIADAFDAMTANRVYRKRLEFAAVMRELQNGRESQFDPELLDLFLKVIDKREIDVDALYADSTADSERS